MEFNIENNIEHPLTMDEAYKVLWRIPCSQDMSKDFRELLSTEGSIAKLILRDEGYSLDIETPSGRGILMSCGCEGNVSTSSRYP